ncbi:hypothetical protein K491DRAFT_784521 [Lophiostoma macrostomum CBS 122681]|uniref:CWH43-like N-terminal domain-containing protein n=1 Tax=Lophiostoma macrostomum CBS 122681 TaxID=1314788 RepID=A0A6A6SN74_9PLEO|nr:hypothetical protein K491DRAFT_784521 [Lophiostoma macrostomum CBS 122681]
MWFISYWFWPVFSSLVWLAMLIAMLVTWASDGFPHYSPMDAGQTIAYISDIGSSGFKPVFIAMSAVTVVSFDVAFIAERWLRHTGRLTHNTSVWQKVYSGLSVVAAIVGAAGLILLSIFDNKNHNKLHNIFLGVFIIGYIVSAIFICWEYQRLGIHFRDQSILRYSFWIKLAFIILEVALAIGFGVCSKTSKWNAAAVLEWTIAFIYFFYVLSFFIDFLPAVRTKHHQSHETEMDMATNRMEAGDGTANDQSYFRGAPIANGHTNGHTNGYTNGHSNGFANGNGQLNGYANGNKPVAGPLTPSQNF